MPLIIDKVRIREINGPTTIRILAPIRQDPNMNENFIILFGDIHTSANFRPCDNSECFELQTTFIEILNKFAVDVRTDFYVEDFMKKTTEQSQKRRHAFVAGTINNREGDHITSFNAAAKHDAFRIYGATSNMIEFRSLYNSCFYKKFKTDLCQYQNIIWQFADARANKEYTRSTIINTENFQLGLPALKRFLLRLNEHSFEGPTVSNYTNIVGSFDENLGLLEEDFSEYLRIPLAAFFYHLYIFLTNSRLFIELLLNSRLFKKQIDKMNKYSRDLLLDPFIQLLDNIKHKTNFFCLDETNNIFKCIHILHLYYSTDLKHKKDEYRSQLPQLLETINAKNTPEIIETFIGKCTIISGIILDIYFILRINKQDTKGTILSNCIRKCDKTPRKQQCVSVCGGGADSDDSSTGGGGGGGLGADSEDGNNSSTGGGSTGQNNVNKKLVLGYFGDNHCEFQEYYLTEIVKTHKRIYYYSTYEKEDKVRRVIITDDIDLNTIMGHILIVDETNTNALIVHPDFEKLSPADQYEMPEEARRIKHSRKKTSIPKLARARLASSKSATAKMARHNYDRSDLNIPDFKNTSKNVQRETTKIRTKLKNHLGKILYAKSI